MRQIKFRAFDPVEKIMVFADVAETDEMNEWVTWELPIDSPINTGIRFDVMQFIDKKDADGIDVYEGDVIQYWELYECHSDAVDYFDVEPQNNFPVDEVFFELKTGVVELVDGAFKVNGTYIFDIAEANKDRIIDNHYQGSLGIPLRDFIYDCYERGITKPLSKGLGSIKIIGNIHQNPELMEQ